MMYPPLAKVRYEELGDVFRDYKILGLSLVQNWVIGPILMFFLAIIFLHDYPEYMVGLIMIGLARCIAMVIVWNQLAKGDTEYAAGLVAFNSVFQVLFYSVFAWVFVTKLPPLFGLEGAAVDVTIGADRQERLHLPRHPVPRRHAHALPRAQVQGPRVVRAEVHPAHQPAHAHRPAVHDLRDVQPQGRPDRASCRSTCVRIAIPLLIYFVVMFFVSFFMGRRIGADYSKTATLSLHRREQQLRARHRREHRRLRHRTPAWPSPAVIGPLVEVPVLIGLVNVALWMGRKYWGMTDAPVPAAVAAGVRRGRLRPSRGADIDRSP